MRAFLRPLLFPQGNVCHICGCGLMNRGLLCPECEARLLKNCLSPPQQASHALRPLGGCLSAFAYRGYARLMVHALKYESDTTAAVWLGERMAAAVLSQPSFVKADCVIPVPLHPDREAHRGYNQSQLLAQTLSLGTGIPLRDQVLVRVQNTGTQVGRSRSERLHAMRGAFAVAQPALVQGKRVLLADDVLTTGATAIACAEALLWAGASSVLLVTACRAERS